MKLIQWLLFLHPALVLAITNTPTPHAIKNFLERPGGKLNDGDVSDDSSVNSNEEDLSISIIPNLINITMNATG